MKLIILLALVGLALSLPRSPPIFENNVGLLKSEVITPDIQGNYNFNFESEDGIQREEEGGFRDQDIYAIIGSYSYTAPDGTFIQVSYIADENGYQPRITIGSDRFPPPPFAAPPALAAQIPPGFEL